MKKIILLSGLLTAQILFSQTKEIISIQNYEYKKSNGLLNPKTKYSIISPTQKNAMIYKSNLTKSVASSNSTSCSCLITVDNTFTVVPFNAGSAPQYRNDDGSSAIISLPFTFNFYGTNYTSLFINNNGNISFINDLSSFSAGGFPAGNASALDTILIAPFWGDVDTRNALSGLVYYKITPTSFIVKWDSVGYYNSSANLRNTFQVILTNGSDPILANGDNVAFCYGDMQWTSGSASQGVNGIGGVPATVGVNKGNKINYFQLGRFDALGTSFDGPFNTNDGISFLDNQSVYFNTTNPTNIPPIIINDNICDTIDVFTGDTLLFYSPIDTAYIPLTILAGENNQTVNASFTSDAGANFSYNQLVNTSGYKSFKLKFVNGMLPPNFYHIYVNTIDNGTPALSSNRTIVIKNSASVLTTGFKNNMNNRFSIYPNPTQNKIEIILDYIIQRKANITDVLGNIIVAFEIQSLQTSVDLSALNTGVYFINIEGLATQNIIKQ